MEQKENSRPQQVLETADTLMAVLRDTACGVQAGDLNTLKALTAALKDLRDIQSKAEAELRPDSGEETASGVILIPAPDGNGGEMNG